MPHIIVMHTGNAPADMPNLLNDLHESLASHDSVNLSQIKTYAIPIQHEIVSDETRPNQMIHIQVRMKPGRGEDLKTAMAKDLHDITRKHVDDKDYACAVSVEIHELEAPSYISSYS